MGLIVGDIYYSNDKQTSDMKEVAQLVLNDIKTNNKDVSFIYTIKYGITYQVVGFVYATKDYGSFTIRQHNAQPKSLMLNNSVFYEK